MAMEMNASGDWLKSLAEDDTFGSIISSGNASFK
jgi:hypothetical protein